MEVFSIGAAQTLTSFRAELEQEIGLLHNQGMAVSLCQNDLGSYAFVDCRFEQETAADHEGQGRVIRYYVANVITDLMLNAVTKDILRRMIRGDYSYFSEEEQQKILQEALAILNTQNKAGEIPHRIFRRNQVLSKVLRYLEHHHRLVLEGFLRFQLKDYHQELRDAVDRSVDRLILEREYREFIQMLRHFVDVQSPRIEEVNIRVKGGGMFSLLDEDGLPIEHEQLRNVLTDLGPEEIDYEDLLLSALITIAPAKVILHIIEPLEVVDTIKQVFGERVVICEGCGICGPPQ